MTMRTSLTSIPRDATSVATSIFLRPSLNSFSAQSRSSCDLSPWIALEAQPSAFSDLTSLLLYDIE
jgi:hypothetical protein